MDILSTTWLALIVGVTAGYWLTPARFRQTMLILATAGALAWASPLTVLALAFAAALAWCAQARLAQSGVLTTAAVVAQLAPLIAWRINAQVPLPGMADIAIPLGLAYIALRGVHYVLEAYKGELPRHAPIDTAGYFFFLPTMVAGPIHRFAPYHTDQARLRWNAALFSEGLERILYGYVKVAVLANLLVNVHFTGWIAAHTAEGSQQALYLTMIATGLNGYLQFAGYSDVAIGFARLLGFRVMENFDSPLTKPNIQRFWGAWHMSLTTWCRDYVYSPIFSLTRMRGAGIIASMVALALWHEFTLRYLAWGIYNGLTIVGWHKWRGLAGERLEVWLQPRQALRRVWNVFAVLVTVHVFFIGAIMVQSPTLAEAWAFFSAMINIA